MAQSVAAADADERRKRLTELRAAIIAEQHKAEVARAALAALNDSLRRELIADAGAAIGNKTHGEAKFEVGGLPYKARIARTVKWDSAALRSATQALMTPPEAGGEPALTVEQFDLIFDVKLSIPEATWDRLPDDLRAALMEARTVTYGALEVALPKGAAE